MPKNYSLVPLNSRTIYYIIIINHHCKTVTAVVTDKVLWQTIEANSTLTAFLGLSHGC